MREEELEQYKDLINRYSHISVREERGKEYIQKIFKKESVELLLDPTLILNSDEYLSLTSKERIVKGDYVVLYSLNGKMNLWLDAIREFVKNKGLKIAVLCPLKIRRLPKDVLNLNYSGPSEFINIMYHASYTFVDSFHGLCFSIKFHKDFYSFTPKAKNGIGDVRSTNLLAELGLLDRHISDYEEINTRSFKEIDYKKVDEKIDQESKHAMEWLKNAIEN